jgi:hypothetical protein
MSAERKETLQLGEKDDPPTKHERGSKGKREGRKQGSKEARKDKSNMRTVVTER